MQELLKIFKLGPADAEKIASETNDPHHHDFEEIIIGTEGQLEHFIDFRSEVMEAPFVSFVTRGKVHRVKPLSKSGKCDMWVIRFKSELVAETAFQLYASFHDDAHLQLKDDYCFERMNILCNMLFQEYSQLSPDFSVVRQLLTTILTITESERRKHFSESDDVKKVQSLTFKNFLELLEANYKKAESVAFYAEKLFMTPRNLNLICQRILQQSVSEIIETRRLTEAKNLLIATDLSVSEIGFELGFNEKTYFTHLFKKKTGVTPTEFREEMTNLLS